MSEQLPSPEDAEIARLRDRVRELTAAARAAVDRCAMVHAHPEYKSVWFVAQLHRGLYMGPQYAHEMQALREALAKSAIDFDPAEAPLQRALESAGDLTPRIVELVNAHPHDATLGAAVRALVTGGGR